MELAILDVSRMEDSKMVGEEKMKDLVSEFWPVQPEPGSVADQLIKKGEAIGIAIGEARGEARGEAKGEARASAKTIRMLQSILGLPESSDEEFAGKDLSELNAMIDALRVQIVNRSAR
jgi:hypothetical protein